MSWPKTPEHGHAKLGDKPAAAERSIMTNQQEAPKSTALDGKTELFHVLGHPLLVRAVDFNRLYAEKERLAALVEAQQPAQEADSQPAAVRDYPPLPDFETVEQHIYGACRRYIAHDMLEPIHNLIRDVIDADRAAHIRKEDDWQPNQ